MRTVRCSGHLGGDLLREGCLPGRDVCPRGCLPKGCLPRGVYTSLPWTDRHLWKHNLSATTVKEWSLVSLLTDFRCQWSPKCQPCKKLNEAKKRKIDSSHFSYTTKSMLTSLWHIFPFFRETFLDELAPKWLQSVANNLRAKPFVTK